MSSGFGIGQGLKSRHNKKEKASILINVTQNPERMLDGFFVLVNPVMEIWVA
jgi:hypothetical protein